MTKYERRYIAWYLKENCNKFILLLVLLFLTMPLVAIILPSYTENNQNSYTMYNQVFVLVICSVILAYTMALYNFRYMMKKGNMLMHMAMPIIKSHMFAINYALGAMVVFLFPTLMYSIAVLLEEGTHIQMDLYLILGFSVGVLGVALYSLYVVIIMKCNNFWDACLVCLAYSVLPVLVIVGIQQLINGALSGNIVSMSYNPSEIFSFGQVLECVSPVAVMFAYGQGISRSLLDVTNTDEGLWERFQQIEGTSFLYVGLWVLLGIGCFFLAKYLYGKRASEDSEQRTTAYFCYPFLSLLIATSFLVATSDSHNMQKGNVDVQISLSMVVVSFIVYLVMNFFAKRKIQVTKGMLLSFTGVVVAVYALYYICTSTAAFNLIQEYPDISKVEQVQVSLDIHQAVYDNQELRFEFQNPEYNQLDGQNFVYLGTEKNIVDKELIQEAFNIQEMLVEINQKDISTDEFVYKGSINIHYILHNQKTVSRSYSIYYAENLETIKEYFEMLVDKGYCGSAKNIGNYTQIYKDGGW